MDHDAYGALLRHIFKQVRHVASVTSSLFVSSFYADARRRMVHWIGNHPRRRLPLYPTGPVPRVSLRDSEALSKALRGDCPRSKPRCRCQGHCPHGAKHGVSFLMDYYYSSHADAALF
jgi:hypothetical protein